MLHFADNEREIVKKLSYDMLQDYKDMFKESMILHQQLQLDSTPIGEGISLFICFFVM